MKICICTTPIRPIPTTYPPFGSMAIIQALRKMGENAQFYNIDFFRYSHSEIEKYFKEHQFDIVGISAVVSTAYTYTKYLAALIRSVSPGAIIIVGGNLAASAEILLRKCEVDICVIGDGELIIQELVKGLNGKSINHDFLKATKGIAFLDERDEFCFTGYGAKPSANEIELPDYSILEADGSLPYFISDKVKEYALGYEGTIEPGKKIASVVMTKGCVSKCTFCHRWEKGYRALPVDKVIEHVRHLIAKYNVGYITIADENFGSDRKSAWEIASRLGKLGVPWRVAGVRARTVSKESLQHWKDNGCYMVLFGTESGSEKILSIMDKNTTVQENIDALRWTSEAGLGTIIQLVLGMPGEDDDTIFETIEFLKTVSTSMKWWKDRPASEVISVNYAQALPGTPLYEYGRQHGLIGKNIDDEEQYLIKISDTDAYREDHFVNATGLPLLKVLMWRPLILTRLDAHHFQTTGNSKRLSLHAVVGYYIKLVGFKLAKWCKIKMGLKVEEKVWDAAQGFDAISDSGYFNVHSGLKYAPLLLNPLTNYFFYPILAIAVALRTSATPLKMMSSLLELAAWHVMRRSVTSNVPKKSLRKIVAIVPSEAAHEGEDKMLLLRSGR